jgi:hypothetical protein
VSAPKRDPARVELFYLRVTEGQAIDLASGFVPNVVRAEMLNLLDQRRQDELRATRPTTRRRRAAAQSDDQRDL